MKTYALARKKTARLSIALLFLAVGCSQEPGVPFEEIEEFGSNPGELRMFKYVPGSLEPGPPVETARRPAGRQDASGSQAPSVPLVVALHGCMQDAAGYGADSGWVRLADRWGFLLLLPEQRRGNNPIRCFNWYSPEDHERDSGEALSIRQMVERMRRDHAVDPTHIYVTGLSAGAAMTLALAAVYPEVFAGAAPLAGIAFGCADGPFSGLSCMWDLPDKEAVDWGAAVRSATDHKGPWPRISVWQGEADAAVDPANATAIVRQWTNIHGIESAPELVDDPKGHIHRLYRDLDGQVLVESYGIKAMGHGIPVDPGLGKNQCGKAGTFFPDLDICSGNYIARFWGLDH